MIYVILPAYNEAAALGTLLSRLQTSLDTLAIPYTAILVNDGSSDGTLQIAQKHRSIVPLEVIDHETNKGLGEAWKSGLAAAHRMSADKDIIVTMDADNTHPPDLIPLMANRIEEGYDVVVASRYAKTGKQVGLSSYRKTLSTASSLCFRVCFPMHGIKDYTCGFRAYRAGIIKRGFEVYGEEMFVREKGFTCIAEVLLKLRRLGIRACEVPLILRYDYKRGASKMRVARTIWRSLMLIRRHVFIPGTKPFQNIPLGRNLTVGSRLLA